MRAGPVEGWILAGARALDGVTAYPALADDVAGMPYALRLACDLVQAGCTSIHVVWSGDAPPSVDAYVSDPRLKGAAFDVVTTAPVGNDADAIAIVRADRILALPSPNVVPRSRC